MQVIVGEKEVNFRYRRLDIPKRYSGKRGQVNECIIFTLLIGTGEL